MAQIIKIQDYISRYEQDPHHYINQFIRLKKQRWDELKKASKEDNDIHLTKFLNKRLNKRRKRERNSP
ncbi:hypothetical protein ACEQPO_22345 [Bacillus sp. SL00103]